MEQQADRFTVNGVTYHPDRSPEDGIDWLCAVIEDHHGVVEAMPLGTRLDAVATLIALDFALHHGYRVREKDRARVERMEACAKLLRAAPKGPVGEA